MNPKFVLIEHSLRRVGGHFFQYAEDILSAAEQAGFQPVLATHRSFRESSKLPPHWPVHPIFPYDWERIHRVKTPFNLSQLRATLMRPGTPSTAYSRVAAMLADRFKPAISNARWWRHVKRTRGFSTACSALFSRIGIREGDQVFCSTMGDADLVALAHFLKSNQSTQRADWHLQFHMNVQAGDDSTPADFDRATSGLRRRFASALDCLAAHRTHFYATTEELAQQYNRLGVARFTTLPWPVGPRFHPRKQETGSREPLRVVCAGDVRHEKGAASLGRIVEQLWDGWLATGRIQLLFQRDRKRRSAEKLGLRRPAACCDMSDPGQLPKSPLVAIKHPLDPDEYAKLIRNAHVGLLMYDAQKYAARCSGILVEFLSAGVPVITPGNCWLSRQFSSSNDAGRTADSTQQVCTALTEILDSYDRYKLAAERFAVNWRQQHSPSRTIELLQANAASTSPALH